jgi:hypothetical protein
MKRDADYVKMLERKLAEAYQTVIQIAEEHRAAGAV